MLSLICLFFVIGATLSILNSYSMSSQGHTHTGKQGAASDAATTSFDLTASTTPAITGTAHEVTGSLATATVVTIWDEDDDKPSDFDYMHLWADQDCYLQFIGTTTNFIVKVAAKVPFTISGYDNLLAAADTTAITGGTEPTLTDIDSIILGNYSGSTLNYRASIID